MPVNFYSPTYKINWKKAKEWIQKDGKSVPFDIHWDSPVKIPLSEINLPDLSKKVNQELLQRAVERGMKMAMGEIKWR